MNFNRQNFHDGEIKISALFQESSNASFMVNVFKVPTYQMWKYFLVVSEKL